MTRLLTCLLVLALLGLNGCATQRPPVSTAPTGPSTTGPAPPEPAVLPDKYKRSYVVFGKRYYVLKSASGFSEQGIASWYGPKFHGRKTANGETYNMHGMSAAHKNLPLGSWVRVTNLDNQRTIDVRINDRGPFVENRVIDLSLAAAKALDVVGPGTAPVRVVALEGTINYTASETYSDSASGGGNVVTATIDRPAVINSQPAPPQPPPATVSPQVVTPEVVAVEPGPAPVPVITEPTVTTPVEAAAPAVSTGADSEFRAGGYVQVASFGDVNNANRMVTQLEQSGFTNVIIQAQTVNDRLLHRVRLGPLASAAQQQALLDRLSVMGLLGARVVSQ